jgi:hypothetical protein
MKIKEKRKYKKFINNKKAIANAKLCCSKDI